MKGISTIIKEMKDLKKQIETLSETTDILVKIELDRRNKGGN